MLPITFYHVIQIIMLMCSCNQSLVTVAFLWEKLSQPQNQKFGTSTRNKLEILHQCGKGVKVKSQKVLGTNSNVCRSYKGKTGRWTFLPTPPPPILNRVKRHITKKKQRKKIYYNYWCFSIEF